MRVLPLLLVVLSACSSGGLGSATVDGQPTATDDGLSLSVAAVEPGGDKTVVELVAVNGGSRTATLARRYAPMTLTDASGQELTGPDQEIEVPAYASDRLRVEFAGRPEGERMTLRAGDLTIADLPTGATRFEAGATPAVGRLAAAQANHANGSTVRVTGVTFGDAGATVQIEAVNGHDRAIELSSSVSNAARLSDETGREYPLVPPASDPKLTVRPGEVLRGTLQFAGRVPATVQRLTLSFNREFGGEEAYSTSPRFTVDLPLSPATE